MKIARWLGLATLLILIVVLICLPLFRRRGLPAALLLGRCQNPEAGLRRVDTGHFYQPFHVIFDLPESAFQVRSAVGDMPPRTTYVVSVHGADTSLEITETGDLSFEDLLTPGFYVMSKPVHNGKVRTTQGADIGEDRWASVVGNRRWRVVELAWGTKMGYPPSPTKYAHMFDQVIASACFLPQS